PVGQRDLTHVLARPARRDDPIALPDLELTLEHDEELAARVSFCRQHLPRGPVDTGHQTGDPSQLSLRQPCEQGHRGELFVDPGMTIHLMPPGTPPSPTRCDQSSLDGCVVASRT